jgi:hypothetical protein
MIIGHLGKRESLRDILICLEAHKSKFYHLGFKNAIKKTTLRDANETRNYLIYEEFTYTLMRQAKELYINDKDFEVELNNMVYAIDSTTVSLCLSLFSWAKFRKNKGGIKIHTMLDLNGNIPSFIQITEAKIHDVNFLDSIEYEIGAYYIMDRGYLDFERLYKIQTSKAYFITRTKTNTSFKRLCSNKVTAEMKAKGLRCDQVIKLKQVKAFRDYSEKLRRIKYYDKDTKKYYTFLTNNFSLDPLIIASLYKNRWKIELFFKWIKQNLVIKTFWGRSENAVKTQIWISMISYLLILILKKSLKIKITMNEILQILSISLFDKTQINQLLQPYSELNLSDTTLEPFSLFDL